MEARTTQGVTFLGLRGAGAQRDAAAFHVLPAPYEATVSYGGGAAAGPEAILRASTQVELFDGECVPARLGVFTDSPVLATKHSPAETIAEIARRTAAIWDAGRLPVLLGGEHTVTLGAVQALVERGESFGVVQFDAHADLRSSYSGSEYSHACVMRRISELGVPIFQIGVRSCSSEGNDFRHSCPTIDYRDAAALNRNGIPRDVLPERFPNKVYVTFDVDAFDASVMPATGTPEPGGLHWYDVVELLEAVVSDRSVLGFDVVELAPIPGLHASDFTAAKLTYTIMGLTARLSSTFADRRPADLPRLEEEQE